MRDLERMLSTHAPAEVLNAGVVGWGPDQEYLRMQRELDRLKPTVVVLAIFADNDKGDLMRDRLFRLAPDGACFEAHHVTLHPALERVLSSQPQRTGLAAVA